MKTAAKIAGLLVGLFLVIGFVFAELRARVDAEAIPVISLVILAAAALVAWFGIRRILRAH